MNASDLRESVTLQKLNNTTMVYAALALMPTVRAAVEPLGEERYRIRIRPRADLTGLNDAEPAMRVVWDPGGDAAKRRTLDLEDVVEADRGRELHLFARGRAIETDHLATGATRRQVWP